MESHLLQYVSDNESSVGGGGDGDNNSTLCSVGGVTTAATLFQCWDCFWLFGSEAALIQHQQSQMCSLGANAMSFMERFRQAQQQALPKRHQSVEAAASSSSEYSQFLLLDTEEGSGTNDPFGDGNVTLDLVSPMDHDFGSSIVAYNNNNNQELDLELKL